MKLGQMSVALASAGLLAATLSTTAQAGALATSVLKMTGFSITNSSGNPFDITTDFIAIVPASSANISATYNGVAAPGQAGGPTPTGQIDLPVVCAGPGCPGVAENAFPYLTNPPGGQFVAADQLEGGTPVAGQFFPTGHPLAGKPIPVGAFVSSGSWAILSGSAKGPNASQATNQLSTTFVFKVATAGTMTFAFNAEAYQETFLSSDIVFPGAAQSSSQFSFEIKTSGGTTVFKFDPDGAVGNEVGVTNEVDSCNLNGSTSRIAPFNQITGTTRFIGAGLGVPCSGAFSATTPVLVVGEEYTLEAILKTNASASYVPEPGVLGLLGLGLLGLGCTAKRRTQKA